MNKNILPLLFTIVTASAATMVWAQANNVPASSTGTTVITPVDAEIITAVTVQSQQDLNFGIINRLPGTFGTFNAVVAPFSTETVATGDCGGNLVCLPTAQPAQFLVQIAPAQSNAINFFLDESITLTGTNGASVVVNNLNGQVRPSTTADTLIYSVGGTLVVPSNVRSGTYSGTFEIIASAE